MYEYDHGPNEAEHEQAEPCEEGWTPVIDADGNTIDERPCDYVGPVIGDEWWYSPPLRYVSHHLIVWECPQCGTERRHEYTQDGY